MSKNYFFIFCFLLFFPFCVFANQAPKIAIIIDDLGNRYVQDERAVHLPGPVVCSILPYTPLAKLLARQAHVLHKEVILHAPMQPIEPHLLGLGGLGIMQDQYAFKTTLTEDLRAVPYVQGVNNHMGSLLTQSPRAMNWVMQTIKPDHLFFIDSVTSGKSVAAAVAKENSVPFAKRDIFLDDVRTPEAVREQFRELLWIAVHKGSAIAIGHPYPVTLDVLEKMLPQLTAEGFELVPVSDLLISSSKKERYFIQHTVVFKKQQMQESELWQQMAYQFCVIVKDEIIKYLNCVL